MTSSSVGCALGCGLSVTPKRREDQAARTVPKQPGALRRHLVAAHGALAPDDHGGRVRRRSCARRTHEANPSVANDIDRDVYRRSRWLREHNDCCGRRSGRRCDGGRRRRRRRGHPAGHRSGGRADQLGCRSIGRRDEHRSTARERVGACSTLRGWRGCPTMGPATRRSTTRRACANSQEHSAPNRSTATAAPTGQVFNPNTGTFGGDLFIRHGGRHHLGVATVRRHKGDAACRQLRDGDRVQGLDHGSGQRTASLVRGRLPQRAGGHVRSELQPDRCLGRVHGQLPARQLCAVQRARAEHWCARVVRAAEPAGEA